MLSDFLDAVDRDDTAALVLLDLSAMLDTVDHEILPNRLRFTFGVDDVVFAWFGLTLPVASSMCIVAVSVPSSSTSPVVCYKDRSYDQS